MAAWTFWTKELKSPQPGPLRTRTLSPSSFLLGTTLSAPLLYPQLWKGLGKSDKALKGKRRKN